MVAKWIVVGWLALSALIYVGKIGKEREPISPGEGAFGVLEYAALIVAIVVWWDAS